MKKNSNLKLLIDLIKNNLCFHLSILTIFFSILYFPHTLIMNESMETIAAFEIDSSLMIDSTFQHLETYNLQLGYMSRFYGWSYFFISYLLLKPIDVIGSIFDYNFTISFNIFLVKTVYFLISLASLLALYWLVKKVFKNKLVALFASLIYLLAPLKIELFVEVKPETTGLLFLFLSQISLINFIEDKKKKMWTWYLLGLSCAIMSTLAKQSFVFLLFPTILTYYWYYIKKLQLNFWESIITKQFFKIVFFSVLLSFLIVFLIYPHLFIHLNDFINFQIVLLKDHGSGGALSLKGMALFEAWKNGIWGNFLLRAVVILWPVSLLISIRSEKNILRTFLIFQILCIPFIVFILCKNSGLFISMHYLAPLFSLFMIAMLLPLVKILEIRKKIAKVPLAILFSYLLIANIFHSFFRVNAAMNQRLDYKNSEVMKVSQYIKDQIPIHSRLAISHGVLVPKDGDSNLYSSCHWWNSCSLMTQLAEFKPNYFIFIENTNYNGIEPEDYLNFAEYVDKNNFQRVTKIGQFVIYKE